MAEPFSSFEEITDVYESLVDWPKRLERETPFYQQLFNTCHVSTLRDVACGTGHHAAMFHRWGLRVEGSDVSSTMIQRARSHFGEPDGLRWRVGSFQSLPASEDPVDAVICVGNSLPLVEELDEAASAVRQMIQGVRAGGLVVLHLLNLWRLPDGPCQWQKCTRYEREGKAMMVVKGVHRSGSRGYVDIVMSAVDSCGLLHAQSVPLLGLTAAHLEDWARLAGADRVDFQGDYFGARYEPETSVDLIAIVRRG